MLTSDELMTLGNMRQLVRPLAQRLVRRLSPQRDPERRGQARRHPGEGVRSTRGLLAVRQPQCRCAAQLDGIPADQDHALNAGPGGPTILIMTKHDALLIVGLLAFAVLTGIALILTRNRNNRRR
jgi:hypothetical protein